MTETNIAHRGTKRKTYLGFVPMVDVVLPGKSGSVEVDHFDVSEQNAELSTLRCLFEGGVQRGVTPGRYARLRISGVLVMTDTQDEQRSSLDPLREARGDVLVAGLGIGMLAKAMLEKRGSPVESLTIIELSPDVIQVVGPYIGDDDRVEIIEGDIYDWKPEPGRKFDCIWFDIWNNICTDNLPEIARLHQRGKFWKRTKDSYMDSWVREDLKYMKRQEGRWL